MAGLEFCPDAARCRVGWRTSIHFDPESWHSMGKRKPVVWFRYFSFSFPLLTSVALRNLAAAGCKMQFQWCRLVWRLDCTNLVPQQSLNWTAVQVAFFLDYSNRGKPLLCRIKHALAKGDYPFCGATLSVSNARHSTTTGRKDVRKPELRTRYDQLYICVQGIPYEVQTPTHRNLIGSSMTAPPPALSPNSIFPPSFILARQISARVSETLLVNFF